MLARTVATVVTGVSAFYAFSVLPLTEVYAIIFASPLLITILAIPVLGEQVRLRRWLAVLVGLGGVMIVLQPGTAELTLGHLAALTAAVCGAVASVIVPRQDARSVEKSARSSSCSTRWSPISSSWARCWYSSTSRCRFSHLVTLALIATFAWIGGRFLISAYNSGEAVIVAPMQYSQIIWATIYGFLLFSEIPGWPTILGSGVIIASGLYIVLRESRNETSETPVLRTRSRPETGTTLRISHFIWRLGGRQVGLSKGGHPADQRKYYDGSPHPRLRPGSARTRLCNTPQAGESRPRLVTRQPELKRPIRFGVVSGLRPIKSRKTSGLAYDAGTKAVSAARGH